MILPDLVSDDLLLALDLVAGWQIEQVQHQRIWSRWATHAAKQQDVSSVENASDTGEEDHGSRVEREGVVFKRSMPISIRNRNNRLCASFRSLRYEVEMGDDGLIILAWAETEEPKTRNPPSIYNMTKEDGYTVGSCNQINSQGVYSK